MTHGGDLTAGHSRIPKERCAEKQLRPGGELGEGSWGQGRPCRGYQHTGKPPRQGFKQDGEVNGAGFQKEQVGCSRGEAGDEASRELVGRGPCLGYVMAVEMSDFEMFLGGVTRMW